jgi:DNA polymerase-3 subunit delta
MRALKPPVHFRQKPVIEQQCRDWSVASLNAALAQIGEAAKAARLNSAIEETLAENLLLTLGGMARS